MKEGKTKKKKEWKREQKRKTGKKKRSGNLKKNIYEGTSLNEESKLVVRGIINETIKGRQGEKVHKRALTSLSLFFFFFFSLSFYKEPLKFFTVFFVVVVATGRVNSKRGKEDKRTVGKNSAERQKKKKNR